MIKNRGSQKRESYKDAGYSVVAIWSDGRALLRDKNGKLEYWGAHDDHAGYTLDINGLGYEFVCTKAEGK